MHAASEDSPIPNAGGLLLRAERDRLRLSQAELGAIIGKDQTAVSRWETGRAVPLVRDLAALERAGVRVPPLIAFDQPAGSDPQPPDHLGDHLPQPPEPAGEASR